MILLEMLKQDGVEPVKVGVKDGGEYASACPGCGGEDRFRTWPERKTKNGRQPGRWWCRGCGKRGDLIGYLREFRGMSYQDACSFLGEETRQARPLPRTARMSQPARPIWQAAPTTSPSASWARQAEHLLDAAIECLWKRPEVLRWLRDERGLSDETIFDARLGWCDRKHYDKRSAWGLPTDGDRTLLRIPRGLVIPTYRPDGLCKLNIRQPEGEPRYTFITGGCPVPMVIDRGRRSSMVVESDLDGWLVAQEARRLVNVVSLGSLSIRPDTHAHHLLNASRMVLVALDTGEANMAGAREARRWWAVNYRQAVRCPVMGGKDPAAAWKAGTNITTWVQAGLAGGAKPMRQLGGM